MIFLRGLVADTVCNVLSVSSESADFSVHDVYDVRKKRNMDSIGIMDEMDKI